MSGGERAADEDTGVRVVWTIAGFAVLAAFGAAPGLALDRRSSAYLSSGVQPHERACRVGNHRRGHGRVRWSRCDAGRHRNIARSQLADRTLLSPPDLITARHAARTVQVPSGLRRRGQPLYGTAIRCDSPTNPAASECRPNDSAENKLVRALIMSPDAASAKVLDRYGIPAVSGVPSIVIVDPDPPRDRVLEGPLP